MIQVEATPADIALLIEASKLTGGGERYSALMAQCSVGRAWAVYARDAEAPAAIWGVTPWPGRRDAEPAEAWFSAGLGASRLMPALRAAIRPELRREADRHRCGVIVRVRRGNEPGLRFAWSLGFAFEETGEVYVGRLV